MHLRAVLRGAVFVLPALITALWLYSGAPELARAPGWFYYWINKGSFDMLLVAAATVLVPVVIRSSFRWVSTRFWRAAGCVVVGSLLLQLATGLIARQGVRGWTERFYVGHGEFTDKAKNMPDALAVLRNYEQLAATKSLGLFGPSKPPGTYAVYFMIDRSSRWPLVHWLLTPLEAVVARDAGVWAKDLTLVTWTIVVLGLCAALTALPLCWLGRALFAGWAEDERTFLYPAWLFVGAPVTNVISVHLDSTVFPLLSATSLALCAFGVRSQRGWAAALSGVVGMLAVYCSYGNLPILGVAGALALGMTVQEQRPWLASWRPIALLVAGAGVTLLALCLTLNWQPLAGYVRGVNYHRLWRPTLPQAWRYYLSFCEFGLFIGPPLMLAFLANIARSVYALRSGREAYGVVAVTLSAAAVMLAISLWLGTPEVARLWMFMLPWVVCAAAALFTRLQARTQASLLLGAQIVLVFFVKNYLIW